MTNDAQRARLASAAEVSPAPPPASWLRRVRAAAPAAVLGGLAAAVACHAVRVAWPGVEAYTAWVLAGMALLGAGVAAWRAPRGSAWPAATLLLGVPTSVIAWCLLVAAGWVTGVYDFGWV